MKKINKTICETNIFKAEAKIEKNIIDIYNSQNFKDSFIYNGTDLGVSYSKEKSSFRVWSPFAKEISILIYNDGDIEKSIEFESTHPMTKDINGTWVLTLQGDYINKYYLYEININNNVVTAVDPYTKAVGVNGFRSAIIDIESTNPVGFKEHKRPNIKNQTDAIIYELHIRDLSMHTESNILNKGKFLGLTETGTKNANGLSTGIDHIKELGVTHLHLLPSFDYKTVDESNLDKNEFNWGYDPLNYNVPEGSYSTNPFEPSVRIKEFKEMVQTLHENGIRVVMDVVYNHTYTADDSNLNLIVPKYFHRTDCNGNFTDGSGCGNETASEREMVRKLILDSVIYWATEYCIDGFRFDLMALHDIETMNQIRKELNKIDPSIIMYGEGWTGGDSPLPENEQALKINTKHLDNNIAAFSDDIRDGIKGSVFIANEAGFVNGSLDKDESVKFGIVGSVFHPQVDINKVEYSTDFWAKSPTQTINYVSAHDNLTLWDKFLKTNPNDTPEHLEQLNKLAAVILLTSQGIAFLQAGEEMARTKYEDENSYKSPDSVNEINWNRKNDYVELYEYYKGLISFRKSNEAFRLTESADVENNIKFLETEQGIIAYLLKNSSQTNTDYDEFLIILNATSSDKTFSLKKEASIFVNDKLAGNVIIENIKDQIITPSKSAHVLGLKKGTSTNPNELSACYIKAN